MMIQPLRDELMVQEQLPAIDIEERIWQHMVAVIMLNQTGRKPVKTVFPIFVDRWPTPWRFFATPEKHVKEIIWPLGLVNVRCQRLLKMTADFLNWDYEDATKLYGIGRYGSESYRIFFKGERFEPQDKELRRYLGYPNEAKTKNI